MRQDDTATPCSTCQQLQRENAQLRLAVEQLRTQVAASACDSLAMTPAASYTSLRYAPGRHGYPLFYLPTAAARERPVAPGRGAAADPGRRLGLRFSGHDASRLLHFSPLCARTTRLPPVLPANSCSARTPSCAWPWSSCGPRSPPRLAILWP